MNIKMSNQTQIRSRSSRKRTQDEINGPVSQPRAKSLKRTTKAEPKPKIVRDALPPIGYITLKNGKQVPRLVGFVSKNDVVQVRAKTTREGKPVNQENGNRSVRYAVHLEGKPSEIFTNKGNAKTYLMHNIDFVKNGSIERLKYSKQDGEFKQSHKRIPTYKRPTGELSDYARFTSAVWKDQQFKNTYGKNLGAAAAEIKRRYAAAHPGWVPKSQQPKKPRQPKQSKPKVTGKRSSRRKNVIEEENVPTPDLLN